MPVANSHDAILVDAGDITSVKPTTAIHSERVLQVIPLHNNGAADLHTQAFTAMTAAAAMLLCFAAAVNAWAAEAVQQQCSVLMQL